MRIESTHRSSSTSKAAGAARSGATPAFVPAGMDESAPIASAAPAAPVAALDTILAIQAVADPLTGRRKAVRRGNDLLDQLEAIKADLLVGPVDPARLDALSALLGGLREATDPDLDAVLDEVELRVAVELAKRGRYSRPDQLHQNVVSHTLCA